MIIVRGSDDPRPAAQRPSTFTGGAWLTPTLPSTDGVTIATATFLPCARTFWHYHENGQIIQVVSGSGFVCTRGEEPVLLKIGDTVWVPPHEQHWHGACANTILVHTAVSLGKTSWLEEVLDDYYLSATQQREG